MAKYMLLLYAAPAGTPAEAEQREAELPLWVEFNDNLRDAGLLVGSDRLHDDGTATTVRIRGGETEVVDGPYAVTKEFLRGYYLLECPDLDTALKQAARVPLARYGSVEVRPIMDLGAIPQVEAQAAGSP
jgi:hypothetical protein